MYINTRRSQLARVFQQLTLKFEITKILQSYSKSIVFRGKEKIQIATQKKGTVILRA